MRLWVLGSQNLLKYCFVLLVNGIQKAIENLSTINLEHSVNNRVCYVPATATQHHGKVNSETIAREKHIKSKL